MYAGQINSVFFRETIFNWTFSNNYTAYMIFRRFAGTKIYLIMVIIIRSNMKFILKDSFA